MSTVRYEFTDAQRKVMERSPIPFAVYQFIDQRFVTLVISDGFCRMFGYEDRKKAARELDDDLFRDLHPGDVSRTKEAARTFALEDIPYDVVYRFRTSGSSGYDRIHARGENVEMEDGLRLAHVWYSNEGPWEAADQNISEPDGGTGGLPPGGRGFAYYDSLTRLPEMTLFFDLIRTGAGNIREKGGKPAVLYMDLIGLKIFNHWHGFAEGDKLLRAVAHLLTRYFGVQNCSRFGQDHFAALADGSDIENTLDRFLEEVSSINNGKSLPVRVGIYSDPLEDVDVSLACDRAKIACDTLRGTYISGYCWFSSSMQDNVERQQHIVANIDRAIEEGWISVYYQPIVRAINGKVCDEDALARWVDPQMGFLSPGDFIPALEDARLIYKLDLHILEQVLSKLKIQAERGLHQVPQTINLSRTDFDVCDIVEEIRQRVDRSGVRRDLIIIEITESIIGSDFDFMKQQIERFRSLGFPIWMDDFGSGYSSLDVLQSIHFDLIKFDMRFMQQFEGGDSNRIILTELMKMATSLGVDTVCEGVETKEQVQFLQEIGCSKLQGFFFMKAIPLEEILDRYARGIQIGFENPLESGYYEALGRINLYDMTVLTGGDDQAFHNYFDTLPMAVIEVKDDTLRYVRSNKSYREFTERMFGEGFYEEHTDYSYARYSFGDSSLEAIYECCRSGRRFFVNETLPDGSTIHSFIRRIAVNPVTGTTAVTIAILSVTSDEGATYENIARALSANYFNLFYVDVTTEDFIEYTSEIGQQGMTTERHGKNFFRTARKDAARYLYPEDCQRFVKAFTKENVLRAIHEEKQFSIDYRLVNDRGGTHVNMKAVRMKENDPHIIIGVSDIDALVKQRESIERIQQEKIIYVRMAALSGSYLAMYIVDPRTDQYTVYHMMQDYEDLNLRTEGDNFFADSYQQGVRTIWHEDLLAFREIFTKENVLRDISEKGIFQMRYHLMLQGSLRKVILRAAMVEEPEGDMLIFGVSLDDREADAGDGMIPAHAAEASDPSGTGEVLPDRERLQRFADCVGMPCCVMSVEKVEEGRWGDIRILCANAAYRNIMGPDYYDGMIYSELVPQDNNFEDYCYRAAILKQRMHAYVETKALGTWTDQTIIPIESGRRDLGYCQFIFEFTDGPEAERMSKMNMNAAEAALRASIRLMGAEDMHSALKGALDVMVEAAQARGGRIMIFNHERRRADILCEYIDPSWPDYDPEVSDSIISYDLMRSWDALLGDSNNVIIKNEQDMDRLSKRNPEWARNLQEYGVSSLVLTPLRRDDEIMGYLYVVNFDVSRTVEVKELAEVMTFFLSSEIANYQLLKRLDHISKTDALTGINNRRAMIERMKSIQEGPRHSFGVISIDLNGLKRVNDNMGHEAGDRLLNQTGEILRKVFYEEDLFRTGGDEFVAIICGIRQDIFLKKVERLRSDMQKNADVSFAIGHCWSDGSDDLKQAFLKADEVMYEDKREFYVSHPMLRRQR